ncbi:TetR/AcrR family transcriptional regulator [Maricaulis salignorans]|uniref:DNA-binding transcriptional regulator, AcrR family n=1 Tax=Maricaulis salignorans TaxID=144026 RepID=A0A1G9WJK8_9PROT|nr:TetR/AcrR family transcriptional regulator [Maricaulis salignorans]SDM84670.1 DNA-binding transcriptional regulator, AcrR family [Maricaulis salignorans]
MGRLSTIRDETVFAAAGAQLASEGAVTLQGLVAATGISIGSLYHRYGSREGLLAQAWIDAVSTFQDRFLAALAAGDEEAGLQAALATPRFCREQRDRAIILCCCRQVDFIAPATPPANLQTVRTINDKVAAALQAHAGKSGHSLAACRMGMVAFPLGAVRLYLPGQAVPEDVDDYVEAGFRAAMNADTGARS